MRCQVPSNDPNHHFILFFRFYSVEGLLQTRSSKKKKKSIVFCSMVRISTSYRNAEFLSRRRKITLYGICLLHKDTQLRLSRVSELNFVGWVEFLSWTMWNQLSSLAVHIPSFNKKNCTIFPLSSERGRERERQRLRPSPRPLDFDFH